MNSLLQTHDAALHVVQPHEGSLGSLRILAGVQPTRGMYFAFESETAPAPTDAALDIHAHARYDESEYVLTGNREIVVGEQRWDASSGFFALAPRHAPHSMRTIGSTPSRWLHFFSPAEIEDYFIQRERLREAGASADQLRALSGRYGVGETIQTATAGPAYTSLPGARPNGIVVTGQATRDAYALAELTSVPEDNHVHSDQEEAFYVISGELAVEAQGVVLNAITGSFVLVPRGLPHRHTTTPGTRLLAIYSPGHTVPHASTSRLRERAPA
jgi:mannose-6-phosphate isomerase-like protein (cupin superfamily)